MLVVKRDGKTESVKFDKITARIQKLCYGLDPSVEPVKVAMKVIEGIYDGVTTSELDNLAAEVAASLTTTHPEYALLASRIAVSNLHKNTQKSFSKTMELLYTYVDPKTGKKLRSFRTMFMISSRKILKYLILLSFTIVISDMIILDSKHWSVLTF